MHPTHAADQPSHRDVQALGGVPAEASPVAGRHTAPATLLLAPRDPTSMSSPELVSLLCRPHGVRGRAQAATAGSAVRFLAAQQNLNARAGLTAPSQRLDTQFAALPLLRELGRCGQDASGSPTICRYGSLTAYRAALSQLDVASRGVASYTLPQVQGVRDERKH
jgi:hypothetical protein